MEIRDFLNLKVYDVVIPGSKKVPKIKIEAGLVMPPKTIIKLNSMTTYKEMYIAQWKSYDFPH